MANKIPREQTEFVTPESLLNFMSLYPGQAQDSQQPGSKSYKIEIGFTPAALQAEPAVYQAMAIVAQNNDAENWQNHVLSKMRTLEQMAPPYGKRDPSKYPYYAGMHIMSFSHVVSPLSLKMKDINLAIPEHRMKYDQAVMAQAPMAYKFCNPNIPADLAKIEAMNIERMARGITPIPEADYHKTTILVEQHEIWSGCYGRVFGRVYWSKNQKPETLGVALSKVLLTREGERIAGGEASADAAFSNFAPPASLAPTAPVPQFPGFTAPATVAPPAPAYPGPAAFTPPQAPAQVAPAGFTFQPLAPQQKDPFAGLV